MLLPVPEEVGEDSCCLLWPLPLLLPGAKDRWRQAECLVQSAQGHQPGRLREPGRAVPPRGPGGRGLYICYSVLILGLL